MLPSNSVYLHTENYQHRQQQLIQEVEDWRLRRLVRAKTPRLHIYDQALANLGKRLVRVGYDLQTRAKSVRDDQDTLALEWGKSTS